MVSRFCIPFPDQRYYTKLVGFCTSPVKIFIDKLHNHMPKSISAKTDTPKKLTADLAWCATTRLTPDRIGHEISLLWSLMVLFCDVDEGYCHNHIWERSHTLSHYVPYIQFSDDCYCGQCGKSSTLFEVI